MTLCCLWFFASMNAHESCWIIIPSSGMISPSPSLEPPVMVSITAGNLNQALCNFWCLHLQFFHCGNPHPHSEFSHPNRSQYLNDQSMTNQWPMPVQQFISCWSHVHSFWLRSSTIFGASIILENPAESSRSRVTRWPLVTSGDLSKNMVRLALPQWWPGFPRISQLGTLDTGYEISQGDSDFNYNVYNIYIYIYIYIYYIIIILYEIMYIYIYMYITLHYIIYIIYCTSRYYMIFHPIPDCWLL